jgi:hypothetical protein
MRMCLVLRQRLKCLIGDRRQAIEIQIAFAPTDGPRCIRRDCCQAVEIQVVSVLGIFGQCNSRVIGECRQAVQHQVAPSVRQHSGDFGRERGECGQIAIQLLPQDFGRFIGDRCQAMQRQPMLTLRQCLGHVERDSLESGQPAVPVMRMHSRQRSSGLDRERC